MPSVVQGAAQRSRREIDETGARPHGAGLRRSDGDAGQPSMLLTHRSRRTSVGHTSLAAAGAAASSAEGPTAIPRYVIHPYS